MTKPFTFNDALVALASGISAMDKRVYSLENNVVNLIKRLDALQGRPTAPEILNWPTLDPIAPTPSDRQGFEPREYTERS